MLDNVTRWLFDPSGLTAHGFCLLWEPGLIWTHAISDVAIGVAYFTIPVALAVFARRRRDLIFRPVLWLFAAFILLCGAGHWLDLLTMWVPVYGIEGVVKAATAVVSVVTAISLWILLPAALRLPSPAQLREAGDALRESEARRRASFELSPAPLHMLDGNGIITGVSDSWLALLGYTRDEVIGRPIGAFGAPGNEPWTAADREELAAGGELRNPERQFRRADGSIVDTLVSARIERRDGETWTICVVIDITARRRVEAALRLSEERLHQAQKMEAVGQLTGGIAHDFNNMLQGIGGCLDLMDRRIAQGRSEEVVRYVAAARESVDRAAGLTHRMLSFARRQALQPGPVDPDQLVLGMEDLIRRTVGPAIQLDLSLHDGVWSALCDPNQLESALLNLAINARDAMPDGGSLIISTADKTVTEADLSGQDDAEAGGYVEIAVRDTGTGMAPEVMARVFEPFFTTKPIGQGTGLGLSQLYGFVRQSGGFVRLHSQPGEGTTVRLYLPRHFGDPPEAAPVPQQADPAQVEATINATILVVEDEPGLRGLICEALRDPGWAVLEAADSSGGLRILQSDAPIDLLVTDVGLPGLNGRQLSDAARAILPGLPVLLITGYAGTALSEMELAPGLEIMRKPFPLDALAERVRAMLEASLVRSA